MNIIDIEKLDYLLNRISKCPKYAYISPQINRLFDLHNDKLWVIELVLSTREYNEDNYIKVINDIVLYYETRNMIEEFKQILKNIALTLDITTEDNCGYHQTDKQPNRLLIIGDDQQNRKNKRIQELLSRL
jgi:hypothetical protein